MTIHFCHPERGEESTIVYCHPERSEGSLNHKNEIVSNNIILMKKLSILLLAYLTAALSFAQVTEGINYQAVARNANNDLVANQAIGLRLSITTGSVNGPVVYTETHTVTSDANGIINLVVGKGTTGNNFNTINWGASATFLRTEMDLTGGTNYVVMGTMRFATVPYAEYAKNAGSVSVTLTNVLTKGNDAGNVQIKNLAAPTEANDAVTKGYVDALIARIEALENGTSTGGGNTLTDSRDGKVYQTVTIGNQVWMAENLAYLPSVNGKYDYIAFATNTYPSYYVSDYDGTDVSEAKATDNYATYGVLYNWPAAMVGSATSATNPSGVQGVCPAGWHLPSDAEWKELINYLGGESVAGGKLKETGTTHWASPNTGATNESGFTALPGGFFDNNKFDFDSGRDYGFWWSTTEYIPELSLSERYLFNYRMNNYDSNVDRRYIYGDGLSVRCVRD